MGRAEEFKFPEGKIHYPRRPFSCISRVIMGNVVQRKSFEMGGEKPDDSLRAPGVFQAGRWKIARGLSHAGCRHMLCMESVAKAHPERTEPAKYD
jgi:hypothetical protein